jgi:precorrin-6A synthase
MTSGAAPRRIRIIGIGAGHPDQVTVEAIEALRSVDYFVTADKSDKGGDQLLAARRGGARSRA